MRQGLVSALTHKDTHATGRPKPLELIGIDTEAGMLSGISRKRSVRSSPYWFTEFCNSQCLSHFAAPFIVVRAETSVAESCNGMNEWTSHPRINAFMHSNCQTQTWQQDRKGRRSKPTLTAREFLHGGIDAISIPTQSLTNFYSQ